MVVTKKLGNIAEATSSKVELAHAQMYDGPMGGSDLGTFYSPYGSSSGGGGLNSYLQDMGLIQGSTIRLLGCVLTSISV